jgi:dTDP-4-amino-4,6-dideoxygalactose transaminase
MGGNELSYIKEAFDTNWVAPLGANVDAFEESLANYSGIKHVAALSSGTAAIHLALVILGVERADEIITSTFTFSATVNPIVYQGALPVFIDSEKDTWNMDPTILESAIKDRLCKGKKPKAIIPVHLYGMPANLKEIMRIADEYQIPVIEDAAEALGSRYMKRQVGTFGIMGVFSFNGNKIITTSGGGALISNNKDYIDKAKFLASQARENAPYYQHTRIGFNYRLSNISAGIGRGQMEVIQDRVEKRRKNFLFYRENLAKIIGIKFLEEPNEMYLSNHWLTTILIDPKETGGITSDILHRELEKENIETRLLWKPMHLQPVFSYCPAYLNGFSSEFFNNGLCLPSGSNLSDQDRTRIIKALRKILR